MNVSFIIFKKLCFICLLMTCLLFAGCGSSRQNSSMIYPRKPADTEDRKAGAAMLLYEQAEKDLDVNENVIVIPPGENPDSSTQPEQ